MLAAVADILDRFHGFQPLQPAGTYPVEVFRFARPPRALRAGQPLFEFGTGGDLPRRESHVHRRAAVGEMDAGVKPAFIRHFRTLEIEKFGTGVGDTLHLADLHDRIERRFIVGAAIVKVA